MSSQQAVFVDGVQTFLSRLRTAARFVRSTRASWMIVALLVAAPVHAQNVLPNPNFDTVLAPWAQYLSADPDPVGAGAAPIWVASPNFSVGVSGSALVDMTASPTTPDATNAASGISQCVNFTPVAVNFVNYGGSFLVPVATAADSNVAATIEVRLFSSADCVDTDFIDGASQAQTFVTGINNATWFTLGDTGFVPAGSLPVSVASAEVRAYLQEQTPTLAQADYKANFDRLVLIFNSTTPVTLMNYSVD